MSATRSAVLLRPSLGRSCSISERGPPAASSTVNRESSNKPLVELFNDPYVDKNPLIGGAMMTGSTRQTRRGILASLIGTSLEWYCLFLYTTAATLVFGKLFFPTFDPLNATLLALTTNAVAFVARPLGGIVF